MESLPTLLDIRYYDQHLSPAVFKDKGFRGRVILFLNSLRFWLETFIQYQILLCGISTTPVSKEGRKSLIKKFFEDVSVELQNDPTSPTSLFGGGRYKASREARVVTEDGSAEVVVPLRGKPISTLVAEHTVRGQGRYGTRRQVVMEEAFSPVTPEVTKDKE
jgi:hypothetical protein